VQFGHGYREDFAPRVRRRFILFVLARLYFLNRLLTLASLG
jgi:hypothetical protein